MARLAAARGAIATSEKLLDEALVLFLDPEEDPKGTQRSELLEGIDGHLGLAASSVQLAMSSWDDVDPKEGEPEDNEGEDDDEDDEEDEEDEEEAEPRRRAR